MSNTLHRLFERLENLLVRSFRMAAEDVRMEDREEVDWNLFLLVREIAEHHDHPEPYWTDAKAEASGDAHRRAEDRAPEPPASERAMTPERRRAASEEDGA